MENTKTQSYQEFAHQVAGHGNGDCNVGMYKDETDSVLKPLTKPQIAQKEISFYQEIWNSKDTVVGQLKEFVPRYLGVLTICIRGKDVTFLKLQDVTVGFKKPCVADIKIGSQTWEPDACSSKKVAEDSKYVESRKAFKFSIPGYQVHDLYTGEFIKRDKNVGKSLNAETLPSALKEFFNWKSGGSRILCYFFLNRLQEILQWWERQTEISLYASSILLLYDALELDRVLNVSDPKMIGVFRVPWIRAYMIDFSHVVQNDVPRNDSNYIAGLTSLINVISCL